MEQYLWSHLQKDRLLFKCLLSSFNDFCVFLFWSWVWIQLLITMYSNSWFYFAVSHIANVCYRDNSNTKITQRCHKPWIKPNLAEHWRLSKRWLEIHEPESRGIKWCPDEFKWCLAVKDETYGKRFLCYVLYGTMNPKKLFKIHGFQLLNSPICKELHVNWLNSSFSFPDTSATRAIIIQVWFDSMFV